MAGPAFVELDGSSCRALASVVAARRMRSGAADAANVAVAKKEARERQKSRMILLRIGGVNGRSRRTSFSRLRRCSLPHLGQARENYASGSTWRRCSLCEGCASQRATENPSRAGWYKIRVPSRQFKRASSERPKSKFLRCFVDIDRTAGVVKLKQTLRRCAAAGC